MKLEIAQENLRKEAKKLMDDLVQRFVSCPSFDYSDPWLSQLDWTPAKTGKNKGFPKWYREILGKKTGLTLGSQVVPLLMQMTWKDQPLVFDKVKKWGWVNPESGNWERLPHPDGEGKNVGSPLSKHFAQFIEKGVMGSDSETNLAKEISNLSYWVSFQSRFADEYKMAVDAPNRLGIVPTTKLVGALTGRQVHKLWLTAAQCKKDKLGTDLFHVIQPPEGWSMVLWDEDTEEVRIGAIWGDYQRGMGLGATAMSQIAFMGKKGDSLANSTDAHSVTAKLAEITRDEAKTANFRDIFGGGRKTQADAIQTAHPDWSSAQVDQVVSKILDAKRGQKVYGQYEGGTDSFYHNRAAQIADTPNFRLPSTGRMFPNVINPLYDTKGQFYTSRYNFPVQGTGVDILHATAVAVAILCDQRGIPSDAWGYVMARHDEIGYNVKDEYADRFAEIANAAHCWAWSIFLESLGFYWMPTPLARLSAINIDKVYRKEVKNPTDAGYGTGWTFPDGRTVQ
jgi:DNA polymerase gamma 1